MNKAFYFQVNIWNKTIGGNCPMSRPGSAW